MSYINFTISIEDNEASRNYMRTIVQKLQVKGLIIDFKEEKINTENKTKNAALYLPKQPISDEALKKVMLKGVEDLNNGKYYTDEELLLKLKKYKKINKK